MDAILDFFQRFAAMFDAAAGSIERIVFRVLSLIGLGVLAFQIVVQMLRGTRRRRQR